MEEIKKKSKQNLKEESIYNTNGITLIALVVTIINNEKYQYV